MAHKIIIKNQNHGCIWLCGVLLVVCLAIYAIAIAVFAALCAALWFLVRGVWRSLVENNPDSKIVKAGMKMNPATRKILAGIVSVVAVSLIAGALSAAMPEQKEAKATSTQTVATKTVGETILYPGN